MKKIVILALHLSTGGIEKSIITLSNMLVDKYDVEIISNYQIENEPAFKIDRRVKITYLRRGLKPNEKEFKSALNKYKLIQVFKEGFKAIKILYLRRHLMIKAIKNLDCDIVISTRYIHNNLLSKYGNNDIVKIAQEHNNNGDKKYIRKVIKSIKNIDYFMPLSKNLTEFYKEKVNAECIYIPQSIMDFPKEVSTLTEKNIVSVGRLSKEKGFVDLIDVFEIVANTNKDWHLFIAGDGRERRIIEEKIHSKNLENNITLLGFKKEAEIHELLLNSSIYVMPSLNECFPLVLIEAESHGLPLVAFDSAEGAKEIIENNENGYLIPNRDKIKMAEKICELIESKEKRNKMGQKGRESAYQYKIENVQTIWFDFIEKL